MKKLAIYGSGGLGKEVYELALRTNTYTEIIFINDFESEGECIGINQYKFDSIKKYNREFDISIAVGEPKSRAALYNKVKSFNFNLCNLVCPTSLVSDNCNLGNGVIIFEFSTIKPNVKIGDNVLIQPFSCIGHDINIGSHSVLSPFCVPGGGCVIGDRVFIGMHSAIREKLKIGDDVIISMGSVVLRDVDSGVLVSGNPARNTIGNKDHKVFKN